MAASLCNGFQVEGSLLKVPELDLKRLWINPYELIDSPHPECSIFLDGRFRRAGVIIHVAGSEYSHHIG